MVNCKDLKSIAKARLKTVSVLMKAKEWNMAVYIMGLVLECALKSAVCKTLRINFYPEHEIVRNNKISDYFMTHNFDQLLWVSGMRSIFSVDGEEEDFNNWSGFTKDFDNYTTLRYNNKPIDEKVAKERFSALSGIIKAMTKKRKW